MLSDHCLAVCLSVCPVLSCPVCDVGGLWPNSWMDQDETWHGGRPWPQLHCVRWGPISHRKGHSNPPHSFRPMSIVAKRSPITATAKHLLLVRTKQLIGN